MAADREPGAGKSADTGQTRMIVYHCYGGSHSSVVTAAAHLGLLDPGRVPTASDLMALDYFDRMENEEHGRLRHMGIDEAGRLVYVLGCEGVNQRLVRCLRALMQEEHLEPDQVCFVNTLPYVNPLMRAGGFFSRALGWIAIGRPLVIRGTQRAFPQFAALARRVKKQLASGDVK